MQLILCKLNAIYYKDYLYMCNEVKKNCITLVYYMENTLYYTYRERDKDKNGTRDNHYN